MRLREWPHGDALHIGRSGPPTEGEEPREAEAARGAAEKEV